MSALDFCETCGGHGATIRTVTEDTPGLTGPMRKRIKQGRPAVLSVPCRDCDGTDHVTPALETQAEVAS